MNKRELGKVWEKYVSEHLIAQNYKILFENWACRWGEIDIIAKINNTFVFVEVKFSSKPHYSIQNRINYYKKKAQLRAIRNFLAENGLFNCPWRFDVIHVVKYRSRIRLDHYESVSLK